MTRRSSVVGNGGSASVDAFAACRGGRLGRRREGRHKGGSPELGALARKVAVAMSKGRRSISPGITLLFDSRAAFDEHHVDRFRSADLVRHFLENVGDVYRGEYEQWRGKNGDLSPRRLSQTALADTLARYSIFPRTIRFGPGKRDTAKGYFRADFEKAWRTWASHWKGQDQDDQTTTSLRVIRGDRRD